MTTRPRPTWHALIDDLLEQELLDGPHAAAAHRKVEWLLAHGKRVRRTTERIAEDIATEVLMTERQGFKRTWYGRGHSYPWLSPEQWYRRVDREAYRGSHHQPDTWRMSTAPNHPLLSPHLGFVFGRVHINENTGGEGGMFARKTRSLTTGRSGFGSRSANPPLAAHREQQDV